ncbi:MAG TPA: crossover junction endodeoxyribonuclease RuvC [bacterium]|nr:crossover junction endodeoxyribonuclease RuvC [bacterium]
MATEREPGPGTSPGARVIRGARRQLGLDPGYGRLGYAVVEERGSQWTLCCVGVLETSSKAEFQHRLLALRAEVARLCLEWRPQECALETLYFSKNVKTAMAVAEARGVLRLALAEAQVPVHEIAPNAVKLALCGSGSAVKSQVGRMVATLLGLKAAPKPDDAADAAAIALAGLRSRPMRELQRKMKQASAKGSAR